MSTERQIIEYLLANPDDDGPRLVYADWLEEHGDIDRAEFIRSQCRVASLGRFDLGRYDAEAEADRLLARHGGVWQAPLTRYVTAVEFRRGFPHAVALPAGRFAECGDELVAAAPTLRELRLTSHDGWSAMLATPALVHFTSLEGGPELGRDHLDALAASPRVSGLRELRLTGSALREAARSLSDSSHLANLECLRLPKCDLGDEGLAHLLGARFAENLTALDLRETGLGTAGVQRLAAWEGASRLEELLLCEHDQEDTAAAAFVAGDWRSLRRLTLLLYRFDSGYDFLGLTAQGQAALANCRSLSGLRSLWVHTTGSVNAAPLFESPHLSGMEELCLSSDGSLRGLQALARSPMLGSLRSLTLGYEAIAGLQSVLKKPAAAGLRELRVSGAPRSGPGLAEVVAGVRHLTNLRKLQLQFIDVRTAVALAGAAHLGRLVELDLHHINGSSEEFAALADSPHLNRLHRLRLRGWPDLMEASLEKLTRRFGEGVVQWCKWEDLFPSFGQR